MISPALLTLGIAALATCLSLTTKEEIVKVAMGFVAVLTGFVALCFLPWEIKLLVIAIPVILDRLNSWSANI